MKFAAALLVLGATLLAGCSDADNNIKPPHELTDFTPTLQVQQLWSTRVGRGADATGVRLQPAVGQGVVYAVSTDGSMAALDLATGSTLWRKTSPWREADEDVAYAGGPVVDAGVLFVATLNGHVLALEASSGDLLWKVGIGSSVLTAPVLAEQKILVRSENGNVTALNRADGSEAWVYDGGDIPPLTLRGNGNLVVAHGVIFFGNDAGELVTLRLDNGDKLWTRTLAEGDGRTEIERLADADGQLLLSGDTIYATAYHGRLSAVNARTSETLWSQPFSSYLGLALRGSTLVGIDEASNIWAWDTNGGANLWKQDKLDWRWLSPPAIQGGYVLMGDREGYVHWLSLDDGSFAARIRVTHDAIRAQPLVLQDGLVLVEDSKGGISAWKVSGL